MPTRPHLLGPEWDSRRFQQLGWALMPLRLFIGITFLYASLQKLANPAYLRASSPTSAAAQMRALESSSPIGPLLRLSLHAPTLVGLTIAVGELAVSLGLLAGLWTRLAAVGGMLLSLTFFLTVSWATTPYYYGSDIVFVFAWSVFATCGAGGVLSLDAWLAARDTPGRSAGLVDLARRRFLVGARSAALLAGFAAVLGGATAVIGRAVGGTNGTATPLLGADPRTGTGRRRARNSGTGDDGQDGGTSPSPTASKSPSKHPAKEPSGTALAPASDVSIGQGRQFTDPSSGQPAWLLRTGTTSVLAFTAVCTHAGCTVGYDASAGEFVCPCHGGRYSASSGAVLGGPPPSPLTRIPARIVDDEIRVD